MIDKFPKTLSLGYCGHEHSDLYFATETYKGVEYVRADVVRVLADLVADSVEDETEFETEWNRQARAALAKAAGGGDE